MGQVDTEQVLWWQCHVAVEGRWMSVVTAVANALRDIWEVSPWCTVIRNCRKGGSLYIRDLLFILGKGIPL